MQERYRLIVTHFYTLTTINFTKNAMCKNWTKKILNNFGHVYFCARANNWSDNKTVPPGIGDSPSDVSEEPVT